MRSTVLARAAGALAVGAAVGLAVYPLLSVDADEASCSVTPSSYADAVLNPPKGEDTDFFVNTGGIPSLMFLRRHVALDAAAAARRRVAELGQLRGRRHELRLHERRREHGRVPLLLWAHHAGGPAIQPAPGRAR